jgi:hypothetical protein
MKETLKYAMAIGITAAAMFAYMYEAPPRQAVHELAQNTPAAITEAALAKSTEQSSDPDQVLTHRGLSQAELADIDPASIDWEAMKERYRDVTFGEDPMLDPASMRITDFLPEEIAAYNQLHVVPFNPTVEMKCGLLRLEGDERLEIRESVTTNCLPVYEHPEHPYKSLNIDELRELVVLDNDAEAAEIASIKASNPDERLDFALRAAALSGKSGPVLLAAREAGWFSVDKARPDAEVFADVVNYLALENVAALMGDPRALPRDKASIDVLTNRGISQEQIQHALKTASEIARQTLKTMGEMQRDITGATSILELTNA